MSGLAASWGFIAVLVAAVDLGAEALAFLRLAIAAVTLGVAGLLLRTSLRPGAALPLLVLLGVLQGAHWLLFFEAVKLGSVALAVLTFYTAPVILAVAAPLLLPERLAASRSRRSRSAPSASPSSPSLAARAAPPSRRRPWRRASARRRPTRAWWWSRSASCTPACRR